MENISVIKIGKVNYYLSDDLMTNCPAFFKGCRNAREVINKKEIDEKHYIYAAFKNKKWNTRDGSNKRLDKVFFTTKWAEKNIPEFNDNIKYDIEMAPDIIELDDNEKFQDNEGNIIEIEVRGKREYNACYFLVKDVAQGFEMKNLIKILTGENVNYEIDKDYVYFYCSKGKKIKKEMFLTYSGFLRVIYCARKIFNNENKKIIYKWLRQFDKSQKLKKYKINMSDNKILCNIGYVYIVTSPVINACKIGFWRSNLKSLRSRYITSYGNNLILHTFLTKNAYKLEQLCHKYFMEYNISNELFDKKYINKYIKFLNKNYDPVQNNYLDNELNKQIDEESESDYESDEENESDYESDEECNEESDEESESDYENDEESDKESESDDESSEEINEEYYKVFMDILKEKDAEIKEKNHDLKDKDRDLKDKDREIELVKKQHENELLKLDSKLSKKENELLKKELEMTKLQNSVKKSKSK